MTQMTKPGVESAAMGSQTPEGDRIVALLRAAGVSIDTTSEIVGIVQCIEASSRAEAPVQKKIKDCELHDLAHRFHINEMLANEFMTKQFFSYTREVIKRISTPTATDKPAPPDMRKLVKYDAIEDGHLWQVSGVKGRRSGEVGRAIGIVALRHAAGYEVVLQFDDGKVDTFNPIALFPHQEHKTGFEALQNGIEEIVTDLGGHPFTRIAVAKEADEFLRLLMRSKFSSYRNEIGLYPAQYLLATPVEFTLTLDSLKRRILVQRDEAPQLASDPVAGGVIALRGNELLFETSKAAIVLGQTYDNSNAHSEKQQWTATLHSTAEVFINHVIGGQVPSPMTVHSKSPESATKSLVRFAEKALKSPLKELTEKDQKQS